MEGHEANAAEEPIVVRAFRQKATLYDAVAGRLRRHGGFIPLDKDGIRDHSFPPETILFRNDNAPKDELQKYFAHEALPQGALPDSDLLTAVHGYTSRFYEAFHIRGKLVREWSQQQGQASWEGDDNVAERSPDICSMDETALVAFGILLEEAAREILGTRGDLVFTEGVSDDEEEDEDDEQGSEDEATDASSSADSSEEESPEGEDQVNNRNGNINTSSSNNNNNNNNNNTTTTTTTTTQQQQQQPQECPSKSDGYWKCQANKTTQILIAKQTIAETKTKKKNK